MHWFRFHHEFVNDPKVQKLPLPLFKMLVNMWCIASQNNGVLPAVEDCAFVLRETENTVSEAFQKLENLGFIDRKKGKLVPHNWHKRQYKSDTSTERVKRFRKRSKGVTGNGPETETETETDSAPNGAGETPDLKKQVFDTGVRLLMNGSHSERAVRSFIGKCCSQFGDGPTLEALQACQRNSPVDPIAYVKGLLGKPTKFDEAAFLESMRNEDFN